MFSIWKVTRERIDATARLLLLQLRGRGDEGDDDTSEPVDDAPAYAQLGIAVRPVIARTLRALGIEDGDEVALLKLWDKALSPTDLEAGETRVYAAGAVANVLRLLSARAVLDAPEIRLGATAAKKVNREGDGVLPGTLSFTATSSTLTIVYDPGTPGSSPSTVNIDVGGSPAVFTVLPTTTITLGGKTGPGSNKVRAED